MSQTDYYAARFVESFPTSMEPGILYVSAEYTIAGHLCPCGCGQEVITKLSPARWRVIYDGEVSLRPSVAATGLRCNSHYFITHGAVDWRSELDGVQARKARISDQRAKQLHSARSTPLARHDAWWARVQRLWSGRRPT